MRGVGGEMGNFWRDGKNNIFCLQGNIGEYCLPIIFFSGHDYRSHGSDEPLYIQEKKLSPCLLRILYSCHSDNLRTHPPF